MDRKYLIYGIAGLVLILLVVVLGSCALNRNKVTEEAVVVTPAAEQTLQPLYDQWEYLTVAATCSPDAGMGGAVCYIYANNDNTSISNFMTAKGQEGWELSGVLNLGGDPNTTFIFKRPLRIP
jgi:hypothetical protein